jgi:hypothetical protein
VLREKWDIFGVTLAGVDFRLVLDVVLVARGCTSWTGLSCTCIDFDRLWLCEELRVLYIGPLIPFLALRVCVYPSCLLRNVGSIPDDILLCALVA